MTITLASPGSKASPALRKRFLKAFEADDFAMLRTLCEELRGCTDMLPAHVCITLGLPRGSTYGTAAKTIVTF
jgi:hypothetical protein